MIEYHVHHFQTVLLLLMWNVFEMVVGPGELYKIQI